jgi:hypothetical protein
MNSRFPIFLRGLNIHYITDRNPRPKSNPAAVPKKYKCPEVSAYAFPAAVRPRASLGNDLTVERMVLNDNPLLTSPTNPRNMNGIVNAKKAKNEKLVAVVFST